MKTTVFLVALVPFCVGCTSHRSEQLTQREKDQIKSEIKVVCDSITTKFERLDGEGAMQYYSESPDWQCSLADGSRLDFQAFKEGETDLQHSITSWQWSTTRQEFIFLTRDIVICAWDGKDEAILKSGDVITTDPHAYTLIFDRIGGEWKVVYFHDSGIPVTQKAKKILRAAEDLTWEPAVRLPGVMAVKLRGERSKEAYEEFIRYPARYKVPLHVHTYDQTIVVVKGVYTHNGKNYGPGSYLFIPAGDKHEGGSVSDSGTVIYQVQPGPFDLSLAEPPKQDK